MLTFGSASLSLLTSQVTVSSTYIFDLAIYTSSTVGTCEFPSSLRINELINKGLKAQAKELYLDFLFDFVLWSDLCLDKEGSNKETKILQR